MGIWEQLNTRTLFGSEKATASEVNAQEKDIHLEEKNRALLADVKLINDSLMRDGTPIPGTGIVHKTTVVTDDSRTVGYTPAAGEVWQIQSITRVCDDITGAAAVGLWIYDVSDADLINFFYGSSTSGEFMLKDDGTWGGPFTIDENTELQFKVYTSANWSSAYLHIHMCRIR